MKPFAFSLALLLCSGCGIVSKQYYYAPSVPHQTFKNHADHSDFKMVRSRFKISGKTADSIGSVVISNGVGHPLLMGPFLPVIPVGGFFQKADSQFIMELTVNCNDGYFMPLAIDSNDYKRVRDSLAALRISTKRPLPDSRCYMIINDTLKLPVQAGEFFMNHTGSHSYWITADMPFRKINSLKLVTGNALLDSTFSHVIFTRRSRLKFDMLGPGY